MACSSRTSSRRPATGGRDPSGRCLQRTRTIAPSACGSRGAACPPPPGPRCPARREPSRTRSARLCVGSWGATPTSSAPDRRRPDHERQRDPQPRQADAPRAGRRPQIATAVREMNGSANPPTRTSDAAASRPPASRPPSYGSPRRRRSRAPPDRWRTPRGPPCSTRPNQLRSARR